MNLVVPNADSTVTAIAGECVVDWVEGQSVHGIHLVHVSLGCSMTFEGVLNPKSAH